MSAAGVVAGLAVVCAVVAAWELVACIGHGRLVPGLLCWLAPSVDVMRTGRDPTDPERRRLVVLGALSLLGAGWLVAGPWAGLGLAAAAPWLARAGLRARGRRRRAAVAAAAPALARALADALAGGHSVRGALVAAAHGGGLRGPLGEELRVAVAALELGERTDDVLHELARRAGRGPLDTLVAAILLQSEAGGDLAGLLRVLAGALEGRARTLADARSATAQARFTALLVSGLPVAAVAFGELVRPGLVPALVSAPLPALMVAAAAGLQVVAFVCVRRIARSGRPR